MKQDVEQLLHAALSRRSGSVIPADTSLDSLGVERTRDASNGDFATNIAMRLARAAAASRANWPRPSSPLPKSPQVLRVEVAGAGFINFFLASAAQADVVRRVHEPGDAFGHNGSGGGRKVIVEFVSSNPTGPLHVGHGRQAPSAPAWPTCSTPTATPCIASTTSTTPGGRWTSSPSSVWLRYLEACGESFRFPANGYRGDYVREIAADLLQEVGQRLFQPEGELLRQPAAG